MVHKKITAGFLNRAPIFKDPRAIEKIHQILLLSIARITYFSLLCFVRKFFEFFSQLSCDRYRSIEQKYIEFPY